MEDPLEIFVYYTDPNNADSDEDFTDKEEIDLGYDPNDPQDNSRVHAKRILAISFGSFGKFCL